MCNSYCCHAHCGLDRVLAGARRLLGTTREVREEIENQRASHRLRCNSVDRHPLCARSRRGRTRTVFARVRNSKRSEEHTSELQSHLNLVCRLLLEKKNQKNIKIS